MSGTRRCWQHHPVPIQTWKVKFHVQTHSRYHGRAPAFHWRHLGRNPDRLGAENLVLDVQARNYDTAGFLRRDHAVVNIYVQTAVRLHRILGEAIEASLDASASHSQPGLWSDATTAAVATRWGRRAAG